jgi:hypothetical protein
MMKPHWLVVCLWMIQPLAFAEDKPAVVNTDAVSIGNDSDQPQVMPKPKVDLRWVESSFIENLTEKKGFPGSCDPKDTLYAHKKPALVLTAADVAEARVTEHDLTRNGLGILYNVTLVLTKQARERLAADSPRNSARVTVAVNGRYWGWSHYTTDNNARVSESCLAKNFNASIGFMSSKSEAESIANAFRKDDLP